MGAEPRVWLIRRSDGERQVDPCAAAGRGDGREIVNADSMQIYSDLRILTARPTGRTRRWRRTSLRHRRWRDIWSVGRWLEAATAVLADVAARGKSPSSSADGALFQGPDPWPLRHPRGAARPEGGGPGRVRRPGRGRLPGAPLRGRPSLSRSHRAGRPAAAHPRSGGRPGRRGPDRRFPRRDVPPLPPVAGAARCSNRRAGRSTPLRGAPRGDGGSRALEEVRALTERDLPPIVRHEGPGCSRAGRAPRRPRHPGRGVALAAQATRAMSSARRLAPPPERRFGPGSQARRRRACGILAINPP